MEGNKSNKLYVLNAPSLACSPKPLQQRETTAGISREYIMRPFRILKFRALRAYEASAPATNSGSEPLPTKKHFCF